MHNQHMQSKSEILAFLRQRSFDIKKFGALRVGLFGSFVRNESNPDSDIDLVVEFDKQKKTFDNFMGLAFFLEDATGRKVELLTPESIHPTMKATIDKQIEYVSFV